MDIGVAMKLHMENWDNFVYKTQCQMELCMAKKNIFGGIRTKNTAVTIHIH
jgi:hypothetical protein